jgi:hypothetical protein
MNVIGHRLVALALTFATSLLVGCSTQSPSEEGDVSATDGLLGHVHGLGIDPGDDTLYVASHYGVFRVTDGKPERVADRWQDTMGFAIVGPGHFLASGHPDLREDLPASLGLIESRDSAETWTPLTLQGKADFHAIEATADRVYAYDSQSLQLLVSTDRRTWSLIEKRPLLDLVVNPDDRHVLYATDPDGLLLRSEHGARLEPVQTAARLTYIDWEPNGPLVGVATDGTVLTSNAVRDDWTEVGSVDGAAEAFDATPGRWHVATQHGVYESTDDGATWTEVIAR